MVVVGKSVVDIARPGAAAFDAATEVFNLTARPRPVAATTACSVEHVQAAVRYAASHGLSVRVHSTGHASPTARPMPDALLIRTALGGGVVIDVDRRVARVPAGTRWEEVVRAAAGHGLAAPHGSSPTVGVAGYLLRGGVSFYGRRQGVAANSLVAVDLVIADGRLRRADAASDPELFWALRGGGGGFGVVTGIELALFPAAGVITGAAFWPAVHADRLLSVWRGWTVDASRDAATSMRLMNIPPLPEIPPELTAGPVLCVAGAVVNPAGDEATAQQYADDLLGPLRAVADPVLDTWHQGGLTDVLDTHMDPRDPLAVVGDHMLLGELDDDATAELLRVAGPGSGSPLVAVELRQLGGAFSVPDPTGGVFNHIDAAFAYMAAGLPDSPSGLESITRHCALIRDSLGRWDTGRTAPTFVENYAQPQGHLDVEQRVLVDRVRARVDPDGLFRDDVAPHVSAPTGWTHDSGPGRAFA